MYANRYQRSKPNPLSLTAAVGINAVLIGALLFSSPTISEYIEPTMHGYNVPIPPPPAPPKPPEPTKEVKTEALPTEPLIAVPIPKVPTLPTENPLLGAVDPPALPPIDLGPPSSGPATGPAVVDPPKPAPVLVDAAPDPRAQFQPDYPPSERREGNEGAVTVRVLVGADGRVKSVERVRAVNDAFWEATRRQALNRWRFRPATRDGVPYDSWRTMTVRFVLEG